MLLVVKTKPEGAHKGEDVRISGVSAVQEDGDDLLVKGSTELKGRLKLADLHSWHLQED